MDGRGGTVTPGLIQADSTLGAVEVSQVPASADPATHSATISAGFDISLGLNPDSLLLPVSRLAGTPHADTQRLYDDRARRDLPSAGQATAIHPAPRPALGPTPRAATGLQKGDKRADR